MDELVFLSLAVTLPVALFLAGLRAEVMNHVLLGFICAFLSIVIALSLTGVNVMPAKVTTVEELAVHLLTVYGIAFGTHTTAALAIGAVLGWVVGGVIKQRREG
jgi:hypothetical protein